jgi:hypothetical protein
MSRMLRLYRPIGDASAVAPAAESFHPILAGIVLASKAVRAKVQTRHFIGYTKVCGYSRVKRTLPANIIAFGLIRVFLAVHTYMPSVACLEAVKFSFYLI